MCFSGEVRQRVDTLTDKVEVIRVLFIVEVFEVKAPSKEKLVCSEVLTL